MCVHVHIKPPIGPMIIPSVRRSLKHSEALIHQRLRKFQNIEKFCFLLVSCGPTCSGCHFFQYFPRQGIIKIKT